MKHNSLPQPPGSPEFCLAPLWDLVSGPIFFGPFFSIEYPQTQDSYEQPYHFLTLVYDKGPQSRELTCGFLWSPRTTCAHLRLLGSTFVPQGFCLLPFSFSRDTTSRRPYRFSVYPCRWSLAAKWHKPPPFLAGHLLQTCAHWPFLHHGFYCQLRKGNDRDGTVDVKV